MTSSAPDSAWPVPSATGLLTTALVVTFVLSVGVAVAGAWAVNGSLEGAGEIARREERTAYVVSTVGVAFARLRGALLEALTEPDRPVDRRLERARRQADLAGDARRALPPLLDVPERGVWQAMQPRIDRMLARFDRAIAAIEAGETRTAERLLDDGAVDATRLADELDRFEAVSVAETELAIAGIQVRTARTVRLASIAWFGTVAAMAAAWVLVLRVVAEQRRRLAAQMDGLEATNRDLEAFAGRVAHEMRNVLNPIGLGVHALTSSVRDESLRALTRRIDRSCARGRDLVEGLLAFSRGTAPHDHAPRAGVAHEVEGVLEQLDDAIREADVEVTTRVEPGAAAAVSPALLYVVLLNLVHNAVKAMRDRPVRHLQVGVSLSADAVRIAVADTGPGITESDRDRVFEPFFCGDGPRREGVGLGLATVKRIVESHDGRIELCTAAGRGTTIDVELPRATPHA